MGLFFNCSGRVAPGLSPKHRTKGRFRHSGAGSRGGIRMTIVWILIVIVLVLLAIYLFRRVV
jgi:hypothetical protein